MSWLFPAAQLLLYMLDKTCGMCSGCNAEAARMHDVQGSGWGVVLSMEFLEAFEFGAQWSRLRSSPHAHSNGLAPLKFALLRRPAHPSL